MRASMRSLKFPYNFSADINTVLRLVNRSTLNFVVKNLKFFYLPSCTLKFMFGMVGWCLGTL